MADSTSALSNIDWGSALGTVGSLLGNMQESKKAGKLGEAYYTAIKAIQAVTPPQLKDLTIQLQQYVQQGQLTPEQAVAQLQKESEMQGIQVPKQVLDAQYDTLNQLKEIVNSKGLTAIDRAQINDIQQKMETEAKGQRLATQQSFAQRGISGAGQELLGQQIADQAAATRSSTAGLNVAALAQQRALDAIKQQGAYASQMGTEDFNRQAEIAKAQNAINQFNTGLKQQTNLANVAATNRAQELNLANKQDIANKNVGVAAEQAKYNAEAAQREYENQLEKAKGVAGATAAGTQGIIAANQAGAKAKGGGMSDLASLIGPAVSLGTAIFSDENLKTDKKELTTEEVENILNKLTGSKYKYKPGVVDDKVHAGVMAQDLEKGGKPGEAMVIDTPDGKMIDSKEAMSFALAALANMHGRVKKMENK